MKNNNTVDVMASAITSAIQEYCKIYIEPRIINMVEGVYPPINQTKDDIWFERVDTDSNNIIIPERNDDINLFYPIGSIYQTTDPSFNPEEYWPGTGWIEIKDVFLKGCGDNEQVGDVGGEAQHVLTVNEMPSHTHTQKSHYHTTTTGDDFSNGAGASTAYTKTSNRTTTSRNTGGATAVNNNTGGGVAHNNMPPYKVIKIWERIS